MKILVIRFGAMGDLIHVSPSLLALPNAELHVLTSPAYADLIRALAPVQKVWTWEKSQGLSALFAMAFEMRGERFDWVINLHPSLKTNVLCRVLTTQTATYRKEKPTEFGVRQRSLKRLHAVEDFYRVFQLALGLPAKDKATLIPQLKTNRKTSGTIGIIPGVGAHRPNRAWPLTSWRLLIQSLLAEDSTRRIVLIGGQDDHALAEQLVQDRVENHCGQHAILETAELLGSCDWVIGGDTGPLHLAVATGVPVLGLYAPTSVNRTGPLGNTRTVCPPEILGCWPCEKPTCENKNCMADILVETVLENIRVIREIVRQ